MRVLFVTNNNYPYSGTTTNILNKILFEGNLIKHLDSVDVLAGKDCFDDLDFDEYQGIKVYRTWAWSILPKKDIKIALIKNPIKAFNGILKKLSNYYEKKLNKQYFIEKDAIKAFYKVLKRINATKYDIIITISGRYYHTAAVMKYCKETGQKFVLYQVDPCGTNESMSEDTVNVRREFEKKLYESAISVLTTPIIMNEQKSIIPAEIMKKVVGLEFPLVSRPKKIETSNNSVPVCMFIGSIYGGIRNPDYVLKLFSKLIENHRVEFHFVGVELSELATEFQKMKVVCHGVVPLETAMVLMNQADFLINIGNSVTNQVPSKIFDYISSGKPIVNVCKKRSCPTLPYFEKYPLVINLYEEINILDEQRENLARFIEYNYKKSIDYTDIEEKFEICTPVYCAHQMYAALCESCS